MNSALLCVTAREIKALKGRNIYNVRHRRMIGDKIMKKLLLTITLIFCGMMSFAQSDYSVIKGNVSEKNVNITIINTSFGVSSDDNGDFIMMLPKMENKVGLLFSCIGYEDTLISVVPNRDTININFKMKETSYMLDAVELAQTR